MSDQSAEVLKARVSKFAKLMAENDQLSDFLKRIEQRRQELGFSERRTAVEARLSPSQIRTMRRQWREGKQRGVSVRTVAGLAQALQTTPEWLISGTGPEEVIAESAARSGGDRRAAFGGRRGGGALVRGLLLKTTMRS